jgi:hypothetical protein
MAERLKARPEILERRREIVEHPFGSIKQWMNQGAFLMRRLEKVRAEFAITSSGANEGWWSPSRVAWARSPKIRLAALSLIAAPRRP